VFEVLDGGDSFQDLATLLDHRQIDHPTLMAERSPTRSSHLQWR
jgi:hypothetical protein